MTLGERITAGRKARGLSKRKLAEQIGVTHPTISQWESGDGRPSIENLPVIAAALGMSVPALVRGDLHFASIVKTLEGKS